VKKKEYNKEHREKKAEYNKWYYQKHKEEIAKQHKEYQQEHRNEVSAHKKQYYKEHRDEMLAHKKQYYKEHRNERSAYGKQWYEQNKEKGRQQAKAWIKNHKKQWREIGRKSKFKRRSLGFVPLNKPFEGSDAHHICLTFVIYIPREMHKSIYHNIWTNKNMDEINVLAFNYLYKQKYPVGGKK